MMKHPLLTDEGDLLCPFDNIQRSIQHLELHCDGLFTWMASELHEQKNMALTGSLRGQRQVLFAIFHALQVRHGHRGFAACYVKQWLDRPLLGQTTYACRANFASFGLATHPQSTVRLMNAEIVKHLSRCREQLKVCSCCVLLLLMML